MPGEFSPANRRLIEERDLDRCAMCGRPQMGEGHIHHRQLRSQGGKHIVENGVLLCLWCHGWVHGNVRSAIESGFILPSWVDDPCMVAIKTWRGWIMLLADGTWDVAV